MIPEPLTSFGISLAASIANDFVNVKGPNKVTTEIKASFEKALVKFVPKNPTIREVERKKLSEIILDNISLPTSDLRTNVSIGNYNKFFHIFEEELAARQAAFNYLSDIRNEARFNALFEALDRLIVLLNKESSKPELENEYKRQFQQYKKNLESFNPQIALDNLISLEKSFDINELKPSDTLLSNLEILKSQCLELIEGKSQDSFKASTKAFRLDGRNQLAKERACLAYLKLEENDEALSLANEILKIDEYNVIANLVKVLASETSLLSPLIKTVPKVVLSDLNFKRILFYSIRTNKKYHDIDTVVKECELLSIPEYTDFTPLTYNNYKERIFLIDIFLHHFFEINPINYSSQNSHDPRLNDIFDLTSNFLIGVKGSELDKGFKGIKFFNTYFKLLINHNKETVYDLKSQFDSLETKDDLTSLLTANSLQQIDEDDLALSCLKQSTKRTLEVLTLEMFCLAKKEDAEQFEQSVRQYLKLLDSVNSKNYHTLFSIPETLFDLGLLGKFEPNDFISEVSFAPPELSDLLVEFVKIRKGLSDENTASTLHQLKGTLSDETLFISYVAYSFYILEKYEESSQMYLEYVDQEKESFDLLCLIHSLFKAQIKHELLIELLLKWRTKFSFNPSLLKLEIELRRSLFEFDICIEIAHYFFEHLKNDEFVIANYAIAIHESENSSQEEYTKLLSIISDLQFKNYIRASTVAQVLLQNNYPDEGLEILYTFALDIKNSRARTDYFSATIKMPKNTLKDFTEVGLGHFVKYENRSTIKFIEINLESTIAEKLIGAHVNDVIEIKGKFGADAEQITIKRIMNKYLYLHDQILQEVHDNPLSDIPMQSFDVSSYLDEGNILDFFKRFGQEDYDPDYYFNAYYEGKIGFSELAGAEFSNNFIRAYYSLTLDKNGLIRPHPMSYPPLQIDKETNFLLDITSLLFLYELHQKGRIKINIKFILPTSVKSLIRSISSEGIVYSLKDTILNKEYYNGLLSWINDFCLLKMGTTKLEIMSKIPQEFKGDIVRNYLIDISAIIIDDSKIVLISDDQNTLKLIPENSGRNTLTDIFLIHAVGSGLIELIK